MPLFGSKFAFKKAPQRNRNPEVDDRSNGKASENDSPDDDDDVSTTDQEDDDNNDHDKSINLEKNLNKKDKAESSKQQQQHANNEKRRPSSSASINEKNTTIISGKAVKSKSTGSNRNKGSKSSTIAGTDSSSSGKTKAKKRKNRLSSRKNELTLYLNPKRPELATFQFNAQRGLWRDVSLPNKFAANTKTNSLERSPDSAASRTAISELTDAKNRNKELEEENRLLKLKIEILMEMVTETTAELNLKDKQPNNK